MIRAACHCTAVRFEIAQSPTWVLDCNCTLCRRYGAMWSYYHQPETQALLVSTPSPEVTETYQWLDGDLAFHRCKVCGCVTHMVAAKMDPPRIYGVNARMMLGLDPATVTVRQVDNGHSGFFWTRADEPPIVSKHPPMPPLGADDWR
jgi:hypothetical protein